MKEVTIVTALFNIQRQNMDGRTWDEYLEWFSGTLKLKCPMVLFVEESLIKFVEEYRRDLPTKIISYPLEEVPYYYLKEDMDAVIASDDYRSKAKSIDRIECNHSLYSIIQYSKFKWIRDAIEMNPFDSDYYFWLDAGGSRFFDGFDITRQFPGKNGLEALTDIGEKVLVQLNTETYHDLVYAETLGEEYLLDNRSFVCGTFFGMHKNIQPKIEKEIENILVNSMLKENNLNNEQIALAYLVKNKPELFEVYYRNTWKQIQLFTELTQ